MATKTQRRSRLGGIKIIDLRYLEKIYLKYSVEKSQYN